jgi:hypothetical protein
MVEALIDFGEGEDLEDGLLARGMQEPYGKTRITTSIPAFSSRGS